MKRSWLVLLNCCFFISFSLLVHTVVSVIDDDLDAPIVETLLGNIQGKVLTSLNGENFYAYRGIRYAQAPVDNLRFKGPVAVEPWNDTLKATSDSLVCPQPGVLQILMSEDCLKLNVFTRNLTAKSPVMIYIHGGANVLGSGHSLYEAGAHYLLDHDVVLVAFNYRLGALGFLSTKTSQYPGNYGYLDQVLALQWVQDHISNFGGDPNSVTIFGMSAGSMAVSLHLASPLSKGLFHKAIAMSGSAVNHYHIDNLYWTRKLARELSCPQYNPEDMVECLRELSWKTIVNKCSEWEPYSFINMKWNYEVDGIFLPAHPTELFSTGNFNKVPLIVGFTRNELDYSAQHQENNTRLLNDISKSFDLYAPELFLYQEESEHSFKSQIMWKFYMGDSEQIESTNLEQFGQIFSDAILGHGIHRLVQLTYKHQPVYYYRTDYVGRRSLYVDTYGNARGVGHADDLQYIMPGMWYGTQFSVDDPDVFMVNRLTQLWTSFANNGIPKANDISEWKTFEDSDFQVLYNDKEAYLSSPPFVERYNVWDAMFPIVKSSAKRFLPQLKGMLVIFIFVLNTINIISI